ncbi:cupin domain-containing protein [Amycolatopsis sp. FDAARGOS 1241]|uniref:cupin domain-containing protein n=1 Tax=Amycolatopsis sp. FDAARGOS 1241 TaxID=2778070 RepID=UPI00194E5B3F|nr:cupin domain-containing protein [Amycolatopsis sp. FDAARGOS 1241]QRP46550.1 cupin domain-containing protein [Amycolatopsis sp. FDAARGOS 1241]
MSWQEVSTVEGRVLVGGTASVRERERAAHGLVYEIRYPAGVGSPLHSHDHDSIIYVLEGRLAGEVDGVRGEFGPGDTVVHPRGVPHQVTAIVDSRWLEFKTPLPEKPPLA